MATIAGSVVLVKDVVATIQAASTGGKTIVAVVPLGHGKVQVITSV